MRIYKESKKCLNRISSFLTNQTVLNLATSINNIPYCASCFYVYEEKNKFLAFKSKKDSRHILEAIRQKNVAGTILPDQHNPASIKGIQFQGILVFPDPEILSSIKGSYYRKFPYARAISGDIWIIELNFIKMTDNNLGFGKKLVWTKN